MSTKHVWLIVLLASVAMMLAACPAAAPATMPEAPAAGEEAAAPAEEGPCAPATEGMFAGVDPTGQTIVWWHNHTGSRDEKLSVLLEQFNETNECGITIDSQSQGGYNEIRDKINASIAAGEPPAALVVGYQNDQAFYQLNDALVDLDDLS